MNHTTYHLLAGIALVLLGLFLAAALMLGAPQATYADPGVRYAAPAAQGSGDCSSWDHACTLQTALTGAVSGDEIWVKKGVHYPGAARTDSFRIQRDNVQIYGGFAGNETARSQRNWMANPTTLSGDIGIPGDNSDNCYHVLYVDGVTLQNITGATVIDGFTVTAGHANSITWPHGLGGGLFCLGNGTGKECSPTLTNIIFDSNTANYGGGLSNVGANGGVSSPTLTNVVFSNNLASNTSGGGMHNYGSQGISSPTLTNVTFIRNTASGNGGGMYNHGYSTNGVSSPTLRNVTFAGNKANSAGGMHNSGSQGGHSSPTLTNVTFTGNLAYFVGGGMYNYGFQGVSSPALTNVTFSGNQANTGGGAMRNYAGGGGVSTANMTNCVLWGNAGNTGPQISNEIDAQPTISYSLIGGCGGSGPGWNAAMGVDGGNNLDADPLYVGPVAASAAPTAAGNYRLGFGSPAIDTGAPTGCPVTDLDGNPRPNDGTGNEVVICDMGAYEAGTMVAVDPALPVDPYVFEGVSIEIHGLGGRANGALAWLYVDSMGVDHPHATDEMTTGQYWLIRGLQADGVTDAFGFQATLTLPHNLPDHMMAHACRFDGESSWDCARSSSSAGSVVREDVTQFSDWTVSDGMPLAVTLGSFSAQVQGDHVLVAWETLSEVDTLGFNLWRGLAADGSDRELLTFTPAQSPGSTQGAVYQVQDAAVQAGFTYWYWLEDIDLSGRTTLHGPVSATMPAPTAVRLAGVAAASSPARPGIAVAAVALVAGVALWAGRRRR